MSCRHMIINDLLSIQAKPLFKPMPTYCLLNTLERIFLKLSNFILYVTFNIYVNGSVFARLPGCFRPLNLLLGSWTEHGTTFMSDLYSHIGYSTEKFQALRPIVLVLFSASGMLVHFLVICFKWQQAHVNIWVRGDCSAGGQQPQWW